MRVISWNTAHRVAVALKQAAVVGDRIPDVVVLQEVTARTLQLLLPALSADGLSNALATTPPDGPCSKARTNCVAIVSRYPLTRLESPDLAVPWPEKVLAARVSLPSHELEVLGVHVPPGSSNGWTKIETLEGVYKALARHSTAPRILCGDFNSPKDELSDGRSITWAQQIRDDGTVRTKVRFRHGDGHRWDAAERNVLRGLEAFGFQDAFRDLHGHQPGYSFVLNRKSRSFRRRFDDLLLSGHVKAKACRYIHAWREGKLSDHSAVEAELEFS